MSRDVEQHGMNMFCLPPAGSSASIYSPWKRHASPAIGILPLEYPGHGSRVREKLIDDPDLLARDVIRQILEAERQPFILFGHSVGGALLWRVLDLLEQDAAIERLKLLVVSSRPEPSFLRRMPAKHELSDQQIIQELEKYNGTPGEILTNEGARLFFVNIIRNDFHLSDRMRGDSIGRTRVPLLVFYGEEDPDIREGKSMEAWKAHSENWMGCYRLQGDHFYFRREDSLKRMLDIVRLSVLRMSGQASEDSYGGFSNVEFI